MNVRILARLAMVVAFAAGLWTATPAQARITLKSICRVKGQEENTLQGLGIVVGLKGTGDGGNFQPTTRSLANLMRLMGRPLGNDALKELKDVKNVALVVVTATVPAAGARQGDKINCTVSSLAAKSLAGGRLFTTPLTGGRPDREQNPRVFAFAEGPVSLDDPTVITIGRVHAGCRLEEDFFNPFVLDGKITLVLDSNHADFEVAQDVAETINSEPAFQGNASALARAINQVNVEVTVPTQYKDDSVLFVSQIMALPILEPRTGARVVINERAGSIVISGDVEIGAVVVTHKAIVVETGNTATGGQFRPIDIPDSSSPKLKSLVETLNTLHVPTEDIVDIIKGLERNGKLHARLIVE